MSNREMAIDLINRMPEYKIVYAVDMLHGLLQGHSDAPEVEPDEWDLEMIARAERENDGTTVTLEEMLAKDGFTYEDIAG